MKVLVVSSIFPSSLEINKGIYIFQLVRELSLLCEVKVLAPVPYVPPFLHGPRYRMYSRIEGREVIGGVEVFHPRVIVTPRVGRSLYGLSYAFSLIRAVRRLKEKFSPDIILNYWAYPDGFASVLSGKALGLPVIVGGRGCDINDPKSSPVREMVSWTLRKSRRLLAVSTEMKGKMEDLGADKDKIRVIPNGIDNRFRPLDVAESRRAMNLADSGEGRKVILYCGRFSPEKGVDYLLKAAGQMKDAGRKFLVLLVGSGEEETSIRGRISEMALDEFVEVRGEISHEDVPVLMNCADVLCLPSLREGWPNVVVEALACGVPVVASRVGGVPEILSSPDYGMMVSPRNADALADALAGAMEKDWSRETIARAVADRTWEKVAREVHEEIRSTLNE